MITGFSDVAKFIESASRNGDTFGGFKLSGGNNELTVTQKAAVLRDHSIIGQGGIFLSEKEHGVADYALFEQLSLSEAAPARYETVVVAISLNLCAMSRYDSVFLDACDWLEMMIKDGLEKAGEIGVPKFDHSAKRRAPRPKRLAQSSMTKLSQKELLEMDTEETIRPVGVDQCFGLSLSCRECLEVGCFYAPRLPIWIRDFERPFQELPLCISRDLIGLTERTTKFETDTTERIGIGSAHPNFRPYGSLTWDRAEIYKCNTLADVGLPRPHDEVDAGDLLSQYRDLFVPKPFLHLVAKSNTFASNASMRRHRGKKFKFYSWASVPQKKRGVVWQGVKVASLAILMTTGFAAALFLSSLFMSAYYRMT